MKHTSTVSEPSKPFHTLVKLVDAEDIANDKIRTHDLTLEVNSITNQLQSQNLETQQSEHLMFTQSRDPNNKHKPAYKNIVDIDIEQIIPSLLVSRNNEMMKMKETPTLDLNLLKNLLYKTFVLLFVRITPTEQKTNLQDSNTSSQNRSRSHSRDRYRYGRTTTPPQFTRSRYDNYRRDSQSHRSPYRSSYRSQYRRDSGTRCRSRSYSRDRPIPQYTSSYRPPSQPRESTPFRSRSSSETKNTINTIHTEQSNY